MEQTLNRTTIITAEFLLRLAAGVEKIWLSRVKGVAAKISLIRSTALKEFGSEVHHGAPF
jgi:hypothetical protein